MAVNESLYRKLRDAGFSHQAALILADPADESFDGGGIGGSTVMAGHVAVANTRYVNVNLGLAFGGLGATFTPSVSSGDASLVTGFINGATGRVRVTATGLYYMSIGATISNVDAGNAGKNVGLRATPLPGVVQRMATNTESLVEGQSVVLSGSRVVSLAANEQVNLESAADLSTVSSPATAPVAYLGLILLLAVQ